MNVQDLKQIEKLLLEQENRLEGKFSTKNDLSKFATKDDLKSFATKDDLKGLATKEDLSEIEKRSELKFATKDDIKELKEYFKEELGNSVVALFETVQKRKANVEDVKSLEKSN